MAGFVGHSYLVHTLNTDNRTVEDGVDIEIMFKTRHSEGSFKLDSPHSVYSECPGILLLAGQEGKMFLTSYIEDGILHFKVTYRYLLCMDISA